MDMEEDKLQLLIVSIGKGRYGIDIEQIACLTNVDGNILSLGLGQLLAVDPSLECNYSKMLLIKNSSKIPILISEPEEVLSASITDIRKLPAILLVGAEEKGVWGLLPQEHEMIILVDFYKNKQFKRCITHSDAIV